MTFTIPSRYRDALTNRPADTLLGPDFPRHGTSGAEWLEALPRLFDKAVRRWELTMHDDQPVIHSGNTAVVAEVVRADGTPAALKLSWPFWEGATEHIALRAWNGVGAVQLEAAEPRDYALLLERADSTRPLSSVGILDACETIGALITRLAITAPPQIPRLTDEAQRWDTELAEPNPQVPRRLIGQARSHLRDLLVDLTEGREMADLLIHKDLHDGNVLASRDSTRGDWLAIDPQCVAGEPAIAVAPMAWNRIDEIKGAHNPRTHVRMRADIITDAAGLDDERVRAWTFVRLVQNAVWAAQDGDADALTLAIYLAKMFDR